MSNWIIIAIYTLIWIMWGVWSIVEIVGIYTFFNNLKVRYTLGSSIVTYLWIVFTVFWLCYQFIG